VSECADQVPDEESGGAASSGAVNGEKVAEAPPKQQAPPSVSCHRPSSRHQWSSAACLVEFSTSSYTGKTPVVIEPGCLLGRELDDNGGGF